MQLDDIQTLTRRVQGLKTNQDCNIQIQLDKMHSQRLGKKSAEELLSKYQLTQMNTNIRHCENCGSKLLKKITQI